MGYSTDFIGHIDVDPPLNEQEIVYLTALHESRRFDRGDPYAVPGNPRAEDREGVDADTYNRVAAGQPGLWCRWVPCWDGCCLALDGQEKIYDSWRWLEYLIEHFLKPGAVASTADHPLLDGFTFDHYLDGLVVGCRRDNKEIYAIQVEDNALERIVLRPADPRYLDFPPLPYEEVIDRERRERRRRRQRRPSSGNVVQLKRS